MAAATLGASDTTLEATQATEKENKHPVAPGDKHKADRLNTKVSSHAKWYVLATIITVPLAGGYYIVRKRSRKV
jgi:hypothetical protein